jgi:pre-mRNA-splicing factor SYF1
VNALAADEDEEKEDENIQDKLEIEIDRLDDLISRRPRLLNDCMLR